MNLSSYLQMPPAPPVTQSPATTAPQGVPGVASPAAGASLGLDFSQVMAQQIQRLAPQERQTLAADSVKNPEPQDRSQNSQRSSSSTQRAQKDDDQDARADEARTNEDDEPNTTNRRQRPKPRVSAKTSDSAEDLIGLVGNQPVAVTPQHVTLKSTATGNGAQNDSLRTIELSPQVRIITDPQKAPSPESLAAFAKSMGLDESTIQNLLGQPASAATTAQTGAATQSQTSQALTNGAALQSQNGVTANNADAAATQIAALDANAVNVTNAPQVQVQSGAGLALAATTLHAPEQGAGLSQAEMASIQQIQITVLPAAVLPLNPSGNANAATPSTLEMLSLLGTGVDEQDVSALLSRFSEEGGEPSGGEQNASDSDSHGSGFAQVLNRSNTNAANAPGANAAQATPNMSEVYDQLSEKMSTELAARIHKQLSDGEWKMKFGLRPANLGGVEIQLEMKDGKLDAVFHAENPLTRDLLQNSSQRLRDALENFGIHAGQVFVGQGNSNGQQNLSRQAAKQGQVGDNSTSQVKGSDSASSTDTTRNKANASLLDLYA